MTERPLTMAAVALRDATAARHGELPAPQLEQLLGADPELYLAGGPLHDPCAGGEECAALCMCEGGDS